MGTWPWEASELGKGRPPDALSMTRAALVNGPLMMRRRAPFTVMAVSAGRR
ncbi:hypothetical protein [Nonomuraea sp. NPDC049141]|uniref:hypothetical protein n=1 Tax=Nonomuraea sp. NPDC049141 TaxID=3155500 RepID=UPI0033D1ACF9